MTTALEGALHRTQYDLVQFEGSHMAHYLATAHDAGLPTVLHLHNMEWVLAQRFARTVRGPLRWFVNLQAARMMRFETAACAKADLCLTFTPEDSARVRQLVPGARVAVMPGGVDVGRYLGFRDAEDPRAVVLLGAFDWPPNVDSARWFYRAIWPRIVRSVPEARCILVGKQPPPEFYRWQEKGPSVIVTGYVEDVRPYLAMAAVVVVPLRSGGGMRLKIPEAFAMKKAVVSTRLGAEGLGAVPGEHLVLADEEGEFADEVVRLLASTSDRARLGTAAYRWVASHLSWGEIIARVEGEYTSLIRLSRIPLP
jgi:glycosyltransferase involved in cell wall biosynthesis